MDPTSGLDSLLSILDRVHATTFVLCIDPTLVPVLSAVCPYSTLKQHGVEALVPLTETASRTRHSANAVVYISGPEPDAVWRVAQSAKRHTDTALTAVFVPEIPPSVPLLLTKYGVLGELELETWPLGFVPDATQPALLNLFAENTATQPLAGVWPAVWALDALQASELGAVGRVTAVGPRARLVARLLQDRRVEHAVRTQEAPDAAPFEYRFGYASDTFVGANIEQLVVIDRDIDLVTPLLSQTTYEGVLDEIFGVSASGTIASGSHRISLRADPLFGSIAEHGFASACTLIHDSAKQLQQQYKHGEIPSQDSSISEIKAAVSKIGSLHATQQLVDVHTELASSAVATLGSSARRELYDLQIEILDNRITITQAIARIQDLIFRTVPIQVVLRPLCLLCLVRGGIKESVLQSLLYGDILRTYGYENLPAIRYLKKRGYLFSPKGSSFLLSTAPFASLGSMTLGGVGSSSSSGSNGGSGASGAGAGGSTASGNGVMHEGRSGNGGSGGGGGSGGPATDALLTNGPLDTPLSQTYSWYALNKTYKLYPHDSKAGDAAEPYAGYVPLTARVVQMALKQEPVAKTPLEPEFIEETYASKDAAAAREAKLRRTLMRNSDASAKPIVLVVLIGGVTYAEVAAIKRAAQQSAKREVNVVVATTCILTGDKIVLKP